LFGKKALRYKAENMKKTFGVEYGAFIKNNFSLIIGVYLTTRGASKKILHPTIYLTDFKRALYRNTIITIGETLGGITKYFVIPPSVSPIVIVIMYHLVPKPESFEIRITIVTIFKQLFFIWVKGKNYLYNIFIV
jgi:hypothetical protein